MKTLDEIKQMMAADDTAQADEALKELLANEPNNLQAKMLYGICSQLRGDEKTFQNIYDELAPVMEQTLRREQQPETVSLWRKYHTLWMSLIVGGLVLAGTAAAVVHFGRTVNEQFNSAYAGPRFESPVAEQAMLYGGPRTEERRLEVRDKFSPDIKSIKDFSDAK